MLGHWLKPYNLKGKQGQEKWEKWQTGSKFVPFFPEMAQLPSGTVAILGYDEKAAAAIRSQLFGLAWGFSDIRVTDLGHLRKPDPAFAVQVIRELVEGGITVVLMGGPGDLAVPQYQAYSEKIKGVNAALILPDVPYVQDKPKSKALLNRLMRPGANHLFHLAILGYQRHNCSPEIIQHFREVWHYELVSLGTVRHEADHMEPYLRDADMVAFDLGALEWRYAPAMSSPNPNGLNGFEVCHLARYSGISDKVSSVSVGGWASSRDRQHVTAAMAAQIIWYFLEGVSMRRGDFPKSLDSLVEYKIAHTHFPEGLIFWKSNSSGRWWVQINIEIGSGMERHRLIPCTYDDYLKATRNEIPERVMAAQLRYR